MEYLTIGLGLILTDTFNFGKHIMEKVQKAKKTTEIIKHLSKFLPIKTLVNIYKALSHSHLNQKKKITVT